MTNKKIIISYTLQNGINPCHIVLVGQLERVFQIDFDVIIYLMRPMNCYRKVTPERYV